MASSTRSRSVGVGSMEDVLLRQLDAADAELQQGIAGQAALRVALDQDGDVAGASAARRS
jgi:hypothetical protein